MTIEVAEGFRQLFEGLTIGDPARAIKYAYGDQKELNAWINDQNNRLQPAKYPLVWGILDKGYIYNDTFEGMINFVIMTDTQNEKFNNWRYENSYKDILKPVCEKVEQKILSVPSFIQVLWNRNIRERFTYSDEPNYGVPIDRPTLTSGDFQGKELKGQEGITLDRVDARILTFKARIKINCLIN